MELALVRTGLPPQDFEVTGNYDGPWDIEFIGALALTDVPDISVDASGLWGALPNWDLPEVQAGVEPTNKSVLL